MSLTKFERKVKKLGLSVERLSTSVELLEWCRKHKDDCYIPEHLLSEIKVRTSFEDKDIAEYSLAPGTVIPTAVELGTSSEQL